MKIQNREQVFMVIVVSLFGLLIANWAVFGPMAKWWHARQDKIKELRQDVTQGLVRAESLVTPDPIKQQVVAFAQKSGIVFGSFDFAVDRDGGWWFFEVNEQGQFLWLDDLNPELHLQEKFLAFLTSPEGTPAQEIEARAARFPSWQEYLDSPAANQPVAEQPHPIAEFMSLE